MALGKADASYAEFAAFILAQELVKALGLKDVYYQTDNNEVYQAATRKRRYLKEMKLKIDRGF